MLNSLHSIIGTSGFVQFDDIWCVEPYQKINLTVTATHGKEVATLVRSFYPGMNHNIIIMHNHDLS